MADYFTNISFAFEATDEQAAALLAVQDMKWEEFAEIELPPALTPFMTKEQLQTICEDDDEVDLGDVDFERQDDKVWVYGSNPTLERVASLIQLVMQPEKPIAFQWSDDCTKHKLDAFGGGCCVIFKDRIEFENTSTRMKALMDAG